MRDGSEKRILKGVSRSFYLSLRLLPAPMRAAAGTGYLLARTSDTVADGCGLAVERRLELLERFRAAVAGGKEAPVWPVELLASVPAGERMLLEESERVLDGFRALPVEEAELVREVVATIIGGQRFDLLYFSETETGRAKALPDGSALEDYAWRVAGCVGAFWTKLGFLTLGHGFSKENEEILLERGTAYGKGLQLVNILRDLPEDLANGRCYLPVADVEDREALMKAHAEWVKRAAVWVAEGKAYARELRSRRLRMASALPALIAEETLERLETADWEGLCRRIKIPRQRVYRLAARSFFRSL